MVSPSKTLWKRRTRSRWGPKRLRAESLPEVSTLPSLVVINLMKVKNKFFKLSHYLILVTWSKRHEALRVGASRGNSLSFLVWYPRVFCKQTCNVFDLSRDHIRPLRWRTMQIYGWELSTVYHHFEKFGEHRHGNSGDKNFLVCCVTTWDYMFKRLCEFMVGSLWL